MNEEGRDKFLKAHQDNATLDVHAREAEGFRKEKLSVLSG
jgi:hypothetical protein